MVANNNKKKDVKLVSDLPTVEKQQPGSCTDQLHLSSQLSDGWVPETAPGGQHHGALVGQRDLSCSLFLPTLRSQNWSLRSFTFIKAYIRKYPYYL